MRPSMKIDAPNILASDRLVYDALVQLMEIKHICTFEDVSNSTGIPNSTIWRAVQRLKDAGVIKITEGGRGIGYHYEFPIESSNN